MFWCSSYFFRFHSANCYPVHNSPFGHHQSLIEFPFSIKISLNDNISVSNFDRYACTVQVLLVSSAKPICFPQISSSSQKYQVEKWNESDFSTAVLDHPVFGHLCSLSQFKFYNNSSFSHLLHNCAIFGRYNGRHIVLLVVFRATLLL